MTTQINVIFPDVSNDVTPLYEGTPKVLYLLHGLSGNSDEWTRFSKIEYYAKKYNFIIIMPEVQRSFYTTGKVGIDYFHYVADETSSYLWEMVSFGSKTRKYIYSWREYGWIWCSEDCIE